MAGLVSISVDCRCPTSPHVGLDVSIDLGLLSEQVLVLAVPPIPSVLRVKKFEHRIAMGIQEDATIEAKRRRLPRKGKWKAQTELREIAEQQDNEQGASSNQPLPGSLDGSTRWDTEQHGSQRWRGAHVGAG